MANLNKISNIGLALILGPLLVLIIQLGGFMPSYAFIYIVGPIAILIGVIIFVLGFAVTKKDN